MTALRLKPDFDEAHRSLGTALAGKGSVAIFGLPLSGATAASWGDVLRFAVGPAARSPLAWLLVLGSALPLVIARGIRLAWAARLWVLALASWGIAYDPTKVIADRALAQSVRTSNDPRNPTSLAIWHSGKKAA